MLVIFLLLSLCLGILTKNPHSQREREGDGENLVFMNTCRLDWMRFGVLLVIVDFVKEFDFVIKLFF
jgi:hypothetical protein